MSKGVNIANRNHHLTLFGREREQARLRELLLATISGSGGLALIGGEAGIGKTSLVEDFGRVAAEHGVHVTTGRSYDMSITPPYGPWLEILEETTAAGEQLPLGPGGPTADIAVPEILYRQVFNYLKKLTEQQPLLIVLDDAHWADHASLDLMRFLGRNLDSVPILMVVTYRTEDMAGRHPLYAMLPALNREADAVQIDLHRLDKPAVRNWIHRKYALVPESEDRLADYLEQHTEGNPFFASEIMRTIEQEQILRQIEGCWELGDLEAPRMSLLVRQTVEVRLERVSAEIRDLLSVAAVIGQDVPLSLWKAVSGASDSEILAAIDEAVEAWLMMASADGMRAVFHHAIIRQAIYDQLLPPRRRLLHQQVAESLVQGDAPQPGRVAHHFQQTGDIRAVEWLEQAGDNAWQAWAWQEASERFEAAIELLEDQPGRDQDRGWLLVQLAESRRYSSPSEALKAIQQSREIAKETEDLALSAMTLWVQGRIRVSADEHGLPDLEAAISIMNDLPVADRQRIRRRTGTAIEQNAAILAVWRAISGRYHDAIKAAKSYLSLPGEQRTSLIDAEAHLAEGIARAALGEPFLSRQSFDLAIEIYERLEDHLSLGHTAFFYLLEEILQYEPGDLRKRDHIMKVGNRSWGLATEQTISPARIVSPPVLSLEGQWDEVRDIVGRTLGLGSYVRLWTIPYGMMIARYQGDAQRAHSYQQIALPEDFSFQGGLVWVSLILLQIENAALLALDDGDLESASEWIGHYDHLITASERVTGKAEGLLLWARYYRQSGDLQDARTAAESALELAGEPWRPLARLVAHRMLGEIYIQLNRLQPAEEQLQLAASIAEECNVKHEQILVRMSRAALAIAAGAFDSAADLMREARDEAQFLGALLLIERLDLLEDRLENAAASTSYPAGLTEREVDVLRLIVEGDTDAAIAGSLHISPRTVTTHVASILGKTESSSRAAAAAFAVRNGLA